MATRIKRAQTELYKEDFYVWTQRQAELLRARRFEDLDLEHLVEEVEELGDTKRSAVLDNARAVMGHLLKLQHSPATDRRNGWRATVREHRSRLEIEAHAWSSSDPAGGDVASFRNARESAADCMRDHGEAAAADALPETCPYAPDQITGDWLP